MPEFFRKSEKPQSPENIRKIDRITDRDGYLQFSDPYVFEVVNSQPQELKNALGKLYEVDETSFKHSLGLADTAYVVAKELSTSEDKTRLLIASSLLHDIGKIFVDEKIIKKAGKLTEEERREINKHVTDGFEFVRKYNEAIANVMIFHHEFKQKDAHPRKNSNYDRRNGIEEVLVENRNGQRRNGDEKYRELGKILAIIDTFNALMSKRPYKEALNAGRCISEINKELRLNDDDKKIVSILIKNRDKLLKN